MSTERIRQIYVVRRNVVSLKSSKVVTLSIES